MMATAMDTHPGLSKLHWAMGAQVRKLLAMLVHTPHADHRVALSTHLPMHGFIDLDIFDLVTALDDKAIHPSGDAGIALVSMLFHLLGGTGAELMPPPKKQSALTLQIYRLCKDRAHKHAVRTTDLKRQLNRADSKMRPIYAASLEAHLNSTSTDLLDACVAKLRGGAGSSSEAGVMMDCAEDLLNLLMTVPATAPVGAAHRPGEAQLWQLELEIQNLKRRVNEAQLCARCRAQRRASP